LPRLEGIVPRFPTAILSTGLMLAALLAFASGLVLDTVAPGRREIKLLAYLRYGAPGEPAREQEWICAKSCEPMTSF
jgi:hypothetical protein